MRTVAEQTNERCGLYELFPHTSTLPVNRKRPCEQYEQSKLYPNMSLLQDEKTTNYQLACKYASIGSFHVRSPSSIVARYSIASITDLALAGSIFPIHLACMFLFSFLYGTCLRLFLYNKTRLICKCSTVPIVTDFKCQTCVDTFDRERHLRHILGAACTVAGEKST